MATAITAEAAFSASRRIGSSSTQRNNALSTSPVARALAFVARCAPGATSPASGSSTGNALSPGIARGSLAQLGPHRDAGQRSRSLICPVLLRCDRRIWGGFFHTARGGRPMRRRAPGQAPPSPRVLKPWGRSRAGHLLPDRPGSSLALDQAASLVMLRQRVARRDLASVRHDETCPRRPQERSPCTTGAR